jgi:hypothetical protein
VCLAIAGLTGLLFDAPKVQPAVLAPRAAPRVALVARANLDDSLAQALHILDTTRAVSAAHPTPIAPAVVRTAAPVAPSAAPVAAAPIATVTAPVTQPATIVDTLAQNSDQPSAAQQTLDAVSALSRAIQAARNARTEDDLIYAEQQMRAAREQMQAGCGDSAGPMCQSAQQIQSLGF